MAELVRIPGLGEVPKTYVYIGGALIVGIVGYAWWTSQQVEPEGEVYPVDEGDLGYGDDAYEYPGGSTVVDEDDEDDEYAAPTTNSEWTQRAVAYLESIGYNPKTVSAALGKYLARKQVTATQAQIIQQAIGAIGTVPVGEYFILQGDDDNDDEPSGKPVPPHRTFYRKSKKESIGNIVGRYNKKYKTNFTAGPIMDFNRRHRKDSAVSEGKFYWFPTNPKDINK